MSLYLRRMQLSGTRVSETDSSTRLEKCFPTDFTHIHENCLKDK